MPTADYSISASFGAVHAGCQKNPTRWTKLKPTQIFDATSFRYAPAEATTEVIRKDIRSYLQGSHQESLNSCVIDAAFNSSDWPPWLISHASVFREIESAIRESKRILQIEVAPDDGIDAPYREETWKRATRLLCQLGDLFWSETSSLIPVPSIGPADSGSIDLFWELGDLTLLINVPADDATTVTFYGRRFKGSKLSGSLSQADTEPSHLTAWLAGRE